MLGFFLKSFIDVLNYADPQIGMYEILESRVGMNPLNLEEFRVRFALSLVREAD